MDVKIKTEHGILVPDEKYLVAKFSFENISDSEDYIPNNLSLHRGRGAKDFCSSFFRRMCGGLKQITLYVDNRYVKRFTEGKQLRYLQIFNTVYVLVYLVIHLALSGIYQSTRCDVKNGVFLPDDNCTDWASSYVKREEKINKIEENFNNLPTMIALLMGFYVNMVAVRWWDQVSQISD